MIKLWHVMLAVLLWWGCWQSPVAAVPLKVVTTTSDLASLVTVVGGDRVNVSSIALPAQDPHTFEPRLTDVQQLRSAQLVVKVGLDHDLWLDRLTQESGNPALQRGGERYVEFRRSFLSSKFVLSALRLLMDTITVLAIPTTGLIH